MTNAIISSIAVATAAVPRGYTPLTPAPSATRAPEPILWQDVEARFSFDKELSQIIITLCDAGTGEVIQQIPPEKVLQFAQFLLRNLTGKLLDARA